MEVNKFEQCAAAITLSGFTEGRLCIKAANPFDSYDFGSRTDLPGVRPPSTAEEANSAVFIVTWPVTNAEPPYYVPQPSFPWALRLGGFDQTANLPMSSVAVYLTWPGNQNQVTIPSGVPCLAFGEGTYTLYSGDYVDSAAIRVPGAMLQVCNTAEDGASLAGKIKVLTAASFRRIGYTKMFNTTDLALTFEIRP
jgi:hypothetical protein